MNPKSISRHTGGIWFVKNGCVYSELDDGTVVRVALMDREEHGTVPVERDANARYIAKLQNKDIGE